jgi:ankyrin repeat protein
MASRRKAGASRPLLFALILGAVSATGGQSPPAPVDPLQALLRAARTGDLAALSDALAAGAPVDGADPRFAQTALMRAAMFRQPAAVGALLEAGASPAPVSNLQRTALHWAAIGGSPGVIHALVAAGAVVDAADADRSTPLDLAADGDATAATAALIGAGARVDRMREPMASRVALVVGNRRTGPALDVLRLLIRTGEGLEVRASDGATALLAAAAWAHLDGSLDVAREILAAGARRDATSTNGQTPLDVVRARLGTETHAAYRNNLEAMQSLLVNAPGR